MGLSNFPDGISTAAKAPVFGSVDVVNGAGTVTPTAPTPSDGQTATLASFNATLNAAPGGTANATPNTVGGSISGSSIVLSVRDHAGGTVAGTVTVGYTAVYTIA